MGLKTLVLSLVVSAVPAFAAPAVISKCPAGTKAAGGVNSAFEASVCLRASKSGSAVFHGPYVGYFKSGKVQATGQFENGMRTGLWTFFDESGAKVSETNFKNNEYDGARSEFFPNGKPMVEETWAMGKREGVRKEFSADGRATLKTFSSGRLVSTASK